jgi:hypothetical protein
VDGWDGLGRLLKRQTTAPADPECAARRKAYRELSHTSRDKWFAGINAIQTGLAARLTAAVESCADLGVSCSVNEVMIIRMKVNNITIQQFGVSANGEVNIPWLIAGKKDQFRNFADTIAGAVHGGFVTESPKQWIVKKSSGPVDVLELLDAWTVVRGALEELHAVLGRDSAAVSGCELVD